MSLFVVLGLLVCAVPALAAEVVEVRVGKHPTFTRVVFELDRPAGYRIERSDPSNPTAELVVSLEASSEPRTINSGRALIEQVAVEPNGSRSVARVKLAKEGLRLKEMILANPPRIVLDLLNDAPNVASTSPPPSSATETPSVEDDAFKDVVAQIETAPEPARAEVVVPEEVEVEAAVEVDVAMAEASEPPPYVEVEPDPEALAELDEPMDEPSINEPVEELAEAAEEATQVVADATPPPATPNAQKPAPAKPRPMVAQKTTSDGSDWMTYALMGGGAAVLFLGAFFVMRKRNANAGDADDDEWDDDDANEDAGMAFGNEDTVVAPVSDNPFAASETTALGAPEDATVPPMMDSLADDETTIVSIPDEEKESESVVFDDAEENVMDDMEVISREQVNESLGGAAMPPVGGASEDMAQMFAEMTRRMEALESRCDELVDARDRLERQVAAQTEELRVQRAAIARTQRAVRNLGRGEEGEEQEATGPALRDPNHTPTE